MVTKDIRTGNWYCFIGTKDKWEKKNMPFILCRPTTMPINEAPYIEFIGNSVFVHKPSEFEILPNQEQHDRMAFKLKK